MAGSRRSQFWFQAGLVASILKRDPQAVNAKANNRFTHPFHLAAANDRPRIVKLLLERGAGVNLPAKGKLTAAMPPEPSD